MLRTGDDTGAHPDDANPADVRSRYIPSWWVRHLARGSGTDLPGDVRRVEGGPETGTIRADADDIVAIVAHERHRFSDGRWVQAERRRRSSRDPH